VLIDDVIKGDTVARGAAYVQYSAEELTARLRKDVEKAVRDGQDLAGGIAADVALLREGWRVYFIREPYHPVGFDTGRVVRSPRACRPARGERVTVRLAWRGKLAWFSCMTIQDIHARQPHHLTQYRAITFPLIRNGDHPPLERRGHSFRSCGYMPWWMVAKTTCQFRC